MVVLYCFRVAVTVQAKEFCPLQGQGCPRGTFQNWDFGRSTCMDGSPQRAQGRLSRFAQHGALLIVLSIFHDSKGLLSIHKLARPCKTRKVALKDLQGKLQG